MCRSALPLLLISVVVLFLSSCADPDWANKQALIIGAPRADAAQLRERQTRVFHNIDERRLLVETTQVLQDLGFTIEESVATYGVLAGAKNRDAVEAPEVAGQIALTIAFALLGGHYDPVWDTDQVIRVTITTQPVGEMDSRLRVSFERIVTNTKGISRAEELAAPEFSEGFFQKIQAGLGQGE